MPTPAARLKELSRVIPANLARVLWNRIRAITHTLTLPSREYTLTPADPDAELLVKSAGSKVRWSDRTEAREPWWNDQHTGNYRQAETEMMFGHLSGGSMSAYSASWN